MIFAYKGKDRWVPHGTKTIQVNFQANGGVKVYFPTEFGYIARKVYDTREEFEGDWEKLED